jgi:hypothetical protein
MLPLCLTGRRLAMVPCQRLGSIGEGFVGEGVFVGIDDD